MEDEDGGEEEGGLPCVESAGCQHLFQTRGNKAVRRLEACSFGSARAQGKAQGKAQNRLRRDQGQTHLT